MLSLSLLYSMMSWFMLLIETHSPASEHILRVPVHLSLAVLIRNDHMWADQHLAITAIVPQCLRSAGG